MHDDGKDCIQNRKIKELDRTNYNEIFWVCKLWELLVEQRSVYEKSLLTANRAITNETNIHYMQAATLSSLATRGVVNWQETHVQHKTYKLFTTTHHYRSIRNIWLETHIDKVIQQWN